MNRWRRSVWIGLPLLVMAVLLPRKAHARKPRVGTGHSTSAAATAPVRSPRLQRVIDDIRQELAIADVVRAAIVPTNHLVVSVSRAADRALGFELAVEDGFIDGLSDAELRAVVAHELGHVWIFTHYPYLQTEELANSVALRLVDRGTLEGVYEKVWARIGERGALTYLPNE